MSLEIYLIIYKFDPEKFFSAPRLAWQETLEKTKAKFELLTDIDMLLMVEKGIREEYATLFVHLQKLINTWKIMIKIKNCHICNIGM